MEFEDENLSENKEQSNLEEEKMGLQNKKSKYNEKNNDDIIISSSEDNEEINPEPL